MPRTLRATKLRGLATKLRGLATKLRGLATKLRGLARLGTCKEAGGSKEKEEWRQAQ